MLDWELAHLGDPMEDLGWMCVKSWRFGELDKPVGGFGRREEMFAAYEAVSGRRVDAARVLFLGNSRHAALGPDVLRDDAAISRRGPDHSMERAMIGRRASETEIDLLRLLAPRGV